MIATPNPKTGWRRAAKVIFLVILIHGSADGNTNENGEDTLSRQHQHMLQSVAADMARHRDVMGQDHLSQPVLRALTRVRRHKFVPASLYNHAYDNRPLPIGFDQTISQPTIVAMMTELMRLSPGDTILEVGTGSGYQAAVLAEVVGAGIVHTIEIVPELAASAAHTLDALGYDNVVVHTGNGYEGLPSAAPFKAIMVTAAPEIVPPALLNQLQPGGRLVIPVGPQNQAQWLSVWERLPDGTFAEEVIIPVRFVPLVQKRPD